MKHLESGTVITEISIFLYWFLSIVFRGVSLRCFMLFHCCFMLFNCYFMLFHCCFIAISCIFNLFHCSVSFCFTVFHRSVSRCFKKFHCSVSSCFMTIKQVQWIVYFILLLAADKDEMVQLKEMKIIKVREPTTKKIQR